MGAEVWTVGAGVPGFVARQAERAEMAGYDGLLMVDSQNLAGDPYVALAIAARSTDRLQLGTGVTNPVTRHPAVTAAAIASVQGESGGRAVLGIGRGDSALAHIGRAPAPVAEFEHYLTTLQSYLRGEAVPFDATNTSIDTLGLAGAPSESRMHWVSMVTPKVPVDVAATGPRVLALAARLADRVTFAVGADPARVAWAREQVLDARRAAGLPEDGLSLGAYVNVVAHPERDVALQVASGGLASFARFSVMHGVTTGPVDDASRAVLDEVHAAYDMTHHTRAGAPQTEALTPDFAARFAVLGPADECVARLRELVDLGLDRLVIIGPSINADRAESAVAHRTFASEVLPALR
ncbi:MAG: 5,10-methylenetetrahydromethanopterin reductase [Actinomycetota bacterium]